MSRRRRGSSMFTDTFGLTGVSPSSAMGLIGEESPALVKGDGVHFSPVAYPVQNTKGPRRIGVPKGPLVRRSSRAGIPAPRYSRREISIIRPAGYLGASRCVKAIPALSLCL
jgi:hypothetical protein